MKIALDIPDNLHSKLAKKANQEGITVNALLLRNIQIMLDAAGKKRASADLP